METRACVFMRVEPNHVEALGNKLEDRDEVEAIYALNESIDYHNVLVILNGPDWEAVSEFVLQVLTRMAGVISTKTCELK